MLFLTSIVKGLDPVLRFSLLHCFPGADPGLSEGASIVGGPGGILPQKLLKLLVSKMTIFSILRQISYSFNTNVLLVNFAFVKKKSKMGGGGVA